MDEALRPLTSLQIMQKEVSRLNHEKGWYDKERSFGEDVALLHSEVSEMLEAYRDHGLEFGKAGREIASEAADVLIRLLDTCERYGINIETAYDIKMVKNWTRPARHGGKKL